MSTLRSGLLLFAVVLVCAGVGAFLAVAFTERGASSRSKRTVFFRGERIASVDERVEAMASGHSQVRRSTSIDAIGEHTLLDAELDEHGFVVKASYVRPGERQVSFVDGVVVVDGAPRGRATSASGPVVLLELAHRLRLTDNGSAVLLELSSLESRGVTIERRGPQWALVDGDGRVVLRAAPDGARVGPGAFAEGDAPPELPVVGVEVRVPGVNSVKGARLRPVATLQPCASCSPHDDAFLAPEPFIESDDSDVLAFAKSLCQADALSTARLVGEAVAPLVDPSAKARAPSARRMLDAGGDCDGAAALAVAAMRACGFPARAVVGYRLLDPGTPDARLVPHALAEVYRPGPAAGRCPGCAGGAVVQPDPGQWWRLDPTVRQLTDVDTRFIAVATGLGGALSMGRVLGVVDAGDVVFDDVVEGADPVVVPEVPHAHP